MLDFLFKKRLAVPVPFHTCSYLQQKIWAFLLAPACFFAQLINSKCWYSDSLRRWGQALLQGEEMNLSAFCMNGRRHSGNRLWLGKLGYSVQCDRTWKEDCAFDSNIQYIIRIIYLDYSDVLKKWGARGITWWWSGSAVGVESNDQHLLSLQFLKIWFTFFWV